MSLSVDLNCDMGESFAAWKMGDDRAMLDIVTTANIACGFHAGDPMVMHETLTLARERGVQVGAHPSFMDLVGFGRRRLEGEDPQDLEKQLIYQIGAMVAMARAVGHPIRHVKTHGSLGNMAAEDREMALAVSRAIQAVDGKLIHLCMPGMETSLTAQELGLKVGNEVFADRAYADNGNLLSRKLPGAVIHDPDAAADRVLRMLEEQAVTTVSGKQIPLAIDSICVHGDTPGAVAMAETLRRRLESAGVAIRPMADLVEAR
ncbi:LamB/YcsF family protein [Salinicola avicenniae]|uniref:LamB/YcsF family protein n=1 Tax=Salinicola avicenniae TaxID=2916836 RepID=UPI00207380C1|nr:MULTISPECIES: 5-oxoprolinase subunit PxpA [unclassified Salinicola]